MSEAAHPGPQVRRRSVRRRPPAAVTVSAGSLAAVAALAGLAAHPLLCLGVAVASLLAVRAELSRVVIVYTAAVAFCVVVAPRLMSGPNPTVPGARAPVLGPPDTYAALWLAVAVFAGVVTSCLTRRRADPPRREAVQNRADARRAWYRFWDPPVEAVLPLSGFALAVQVALLAKERVGVPAQLAGGSSGGGYLGLVATAGALLAAGCLLRIRTTGKLRSWSGAAAGGLLVGHLGAMTATGFRSAAPLLCIALALVATGTRLKGSSPVQARRWRPVLAPLVGLALLVGVVVPTYLIGAELRSQQATKRYAVTDGLDIANFTLARLDYRPFLVRAVELRDNPRAEAAVALDSQATAFVPRLFYPGKPTIDYHQRVSRAFFHYAADDVTASPITSFGDGVVNLGVAGAVVAVGLYVFGLDWTFRLLQRRHRVGGFAVQIAIIMYAVDIGNPVVLGLASAVRTALMVFLLVAAAGLAAWLATRLVARFVARPVSAAAAEPVSSGAAEPVSSAAAELVVTAADGDSRACQPDPVR